MALTFQEKLLFLLAFGVGLLFLNWLRLQIQRTWNDFRIDKMLSHISQPKGGYPLIGHTLTHLNKGQPWKIICLDFPELSDVPLVRFQMFRDRVLVVTEPFLISRVLQTHQRKYNKHLNSYSDFMCLLGSGLVTSEGRKWFHGRALLSSVMRVEILDDLSPIAVGACDRLLKNIQDHNNINNSTVSSATTNNNTDFDLQSGFHKLTLQVIGRALLSLDAEECENVFAKLYLPIVDECNARVWAPWKKYMPWTKGYQEQSACLDKLNTYFVNMIKTRWAARQRGERDPNKNPGLKEDILDLYMSKLTEMDAETTRQLRDDLKTMVLAGHETTAAMLTWTMYELISNPDCAAKVREEHARVFKDVDVKNGQHATLKHLHQLVYTRACLREALRKYSVVPLVMRVANEDDFIRKTDSGLPYDLTIPKGTAIAVGITSVHNNPEIWPEPRKYNPERFVELDDKMETVQYSFIPFITGPRHCLGQHISLTEAQYIISYLVSHVGSMKLGENASGNPHKFIVPQVPENGLPVKFEQVSRLL